MRPNYRIDDLEYNFSLARRYVATENTNVTGYRLFYDDYGPACDLPVNAIAYDLTWGGDLVAGKPETWEALKEHVWLLIQGYHDLQRGQYKHKANVYGRMDLWLQRNEALRSMNEDALKKIKLPFPLFGA